MAITTSNTTSATTVAPTTPASAGIAKALGAGSGVDTAALVKSLVEAQFAGKNAQLARRSETLTAQISTLSEVRSGITGFADALTTLVRGGTLATQVSSSGAAVRATALPGARVAGTDASVTVNRLATAQVAVMRDPLPANGSVGTGTLQLRLGTVDAGGSFAWDGKAIPPIAIGAAEATSLQAVADKITAARAGITASVVNDAGGQRLVLKGATGAAQAFTLTAAPDAGSPGLERLNVDFGGGTTGAKVTARAGNAELTIDGVELSRDSNSVTGAIPGVRLDLAGLTAGVPVAIGTVPPTDAITQAVNDFVATYNGVLSTVQKATDPVNGALRTDSATTTLKRSLQRMTLTELTTATDGGPRTLAAIGVATNRDGTLRVDAAQLARALAEHPQAVEAIFAPGTGASGRGLSGALNAISIAAIDSKTGLGATAARYGKAQTTIDDERKKLTGDTEVATTRMTQQFAASEARVAAYKAQQTFMENQIKMWTKDS